MNGIKGKIVRYFAMIVLLTIIVLNVLLFNFVKYHNYTTIRVELENEIKKSADLYKENYSDEPIEQNIIYTPDGFWNTSKAQVQVIDSSGMLLMDDIGLTESREMRVYEDVDKVISNKEAAYMEYKLETKDREKVMSVSYPLFNKNDELQGVLRYSTLLGEVDEEISTLVACFVIISIIVFLLGIIVSFIMARGVIAPIKEVTETAKKMADGDLTVKSNIYTDDEVGQLSQTLNYMASELTKRDQLKNEFISSVSHELRTPLTAIKGWVITLNNDDTDKEMLKMGFNIIEKEAERLSGMVEELLDFSRLVSGKISLKEESVNINEFVDYIRVYLTPRSEREKIKFIVNCDEELGEFNADGDRLKQVLINIIDNAFKFTEPGGEVKFHVYEENDNIVMNICDTGCGISEEELPRVKEKFYKGKNSKSQNGIGLSICDEIIRLHGGTFNIYSKLDVGTDIFVKIPRERQ